jgi:biotin synthase
VRCIAVSRIVMPRTVVRLSAGRLDLTIADQALAFMVGTRAASRREGTTELAQKD